MVVDCCGNRESTRLASGTSIDMVSATLCQDFCPTNRILHVHLVNTVNGNDLCAMHCTDSITRDTCEMQT